jgi:hypothetical protein
VMDTLNELLHGKIERLLVVLTPQGQRLIGTTNDV